MTVARQRAEAFCTRFGLSLPILQAPMAGACPPALAAAVANAGGMGGCGALLLDPDAIADWSSRFRVASNGAFSMNLWVPDPPPVRDSAREAAMLDLLARHGPSVSPDILEGEHVLDFAAQCEAVLRAAPTVASSIMGLFPPEFASKLRTRGIAWFATATTLAAGRVAEAAGADAVIAQGSEAGGHRGTFDASAAEARLVGGLALIPALADALSVPVIAAGGLGDGRGVAAALTLGASAVMLGTAFLRCPETALAPAWADGVGAAAPEDTVPTRAFSGRLGRALRSTWTDAVAAPGAPEPPPYPLQRSATAPMRAAATKANDPEHMQMWAGQSGALARVEPADEVTRRVWAEASTLLP